MFRYLLFMSECTQTTSWLTLRIGQYRHRVGERRKSAPYDNPRLTCVHLFALYPEPALWPSSTLRDIPRSMSEPVSSNDPKVPPSNPLNRRKPENRWTRILRDADWDQHETVRRWLRFASELFGEKNKEIEEKETEEEEDRSHKNAA